MWRISPCITWFFIIVCCLLLTARSSLHLTAGHYPHIYCTLTDVVLNLTWRRFLYKADRDLHLSCNGVANIWPLSHDEFLSVSSACEDVHEVGHAFTIYYWAGGSNYFHLHYDMMIPLYAAFYHKTPHIIRPDSKHVFMPTVETRRLQVVFYGGFIFGCFVFLYILLWWDFLLIIFTLVASNSSVSLISNLVVTAALDCSD